MSNLVQYLGQQSSRPSPIIFGNFPVAEWLVNKGGRDFFEDFHSLNASSSPYLYDVSDNNATIEIVASEKKGLVRLAPTADDNEECWMLGDDKGTICEIAAEAGKV